MNVVFDDDQIHRGTRPNYYTEKQSFLVKFLISKGLLKTSSDVNKIFLSVSVFFITVAVVIYLFSSGNPSYSVENLPDEAYIIFTDEEGSGPQKVNKSELRNLLDKN